MAIWTGAISAVMPFISFRETEMKHFIFIARTAQSHLCGNALKMRQQGFRVRSDDHDISCEHSNGF